SSKAPVVNITSPTYSNWYASYEGSIDISGLASDDSGEIKNVTWQVEGGSSGSATGTANWSTGMVSLKDGDNKVIVTASDKSGNKGTDEIFIVYNKEVIFVEEPKANPDTIYKGEATDVLFTSKVMVKSNNSLESVILYEVN